MAVAAVALTSCKKDVVESTELGTATINGTIRANINQLNDVNDLGLYDYNYNPESVEGMTVKVEINTANLVQSPESGYTYDKDVYTAVTNANGEFTLILPATEEGFSVTITFEDKFGVTRNMYTTDGSALDVESYVYKSNSSVFIYAGADLDEVYDASIASVNNNGNEYGSATVMGTVYGRFDQGITPGGYEELGSASPFPGKEVILTWDYAPYNDGYETNLTFTIDASGNYVATVPTELINMTDVEFYLGMADFTGDLIFTNVMGTADSTLLGSYTLGGVGQYDTNVAVQDGEIVTGVDFYLNASPVY